MVSGRIIFGLGIVVSVVNIVIWIIVLRSQFKQYNSNKMNDRIKTALLIFGLISLFSNITPIWFDIFQITRNAHPSNIGFAYTISQYIYRTITAFMFYLIYKS